LVFNESTQQDTDVCIVHPRGLDTCYALASFVPGILIADDNATSVSCCVLSLKTKHHLKSARRASSGVDAIEKAKEFLPDVALLDLAMPDLNGIEVASVLKRAVPDIKLMLFTMKVTALAGRWLQRLYRLRSLKRREHQ